MSDDNNMTSSNIVSSKDANFVIEWMGDSEFSLKDVEEANWPDDLCFVRA